MDQFFGALQHRRESDNLQRNRRALLFTTACSALLGRKYLQIQVFQASFNLCGLLVCSFVYLFITKGMEMYVWSRGREKGMRLLIKYVINGLNGMEEAPTVTGDLGKGSGAYVL